MSKPYSIEFAVESTTEFKAMERLKGLGLSKADEAKLSDLDRQAGLFIIKVSTDETELADIVYKKLLAAKEILILSDELSVKRAKEVITLTAVVEDQLKKLLVCVLPETEKVLAEIINTHQKHTSSFVSTSRIEWSRKIKDFSFGELPAVLQEDISNLARNELLSQQGLLSLISTAKDFDTLKITIAELSKSKTVWGSINSVLEKPVQYIHIAAALNYLCSARNDAAHGKTITAKRLIQVEQYQKHIMSYIDTIKSSYRDSLHASMKSISSSLKTILESTIKIDPSIFTAYSKVMSQTFKPFTDTMSKLQLNIISPNLVETIKQNTQYQSDISKSFAGVLENMKAMDGFSEITKQISSTGIEQYVTEAMKQTANLKIDVNKMSEKKGKGGENE